MHGLEPRQLSLKTLRMDPDAWINRQGASVLVPREALETADGLAERRGIIDAALNRAGTGGLVVAVARCCESGEELIERLVQAGTPLRKLRLPNLSNKDIASLRPNGAVFLMNTATYKEKHWKHRNNPEKAFARRVLGVPDPEVRCKLRDGFVTRVIHVGLVWHEKRKG